MRFDRIRAALLVGPILAVYAGNADAMPVDKCFSTPWATKIAKGVPAGKFDTTHVSFLLPVTVGRAAALFGPPNCSHYQVSDLESVDVTLDFSTSDAIFKQLNGAILVNKAKTKDGPIFTFNPSQPNTITFDLDAVDFDHSVPSVLNFSFENFVPYKSGPDAVYWTVTQITLALSGEDFFTPPEPASAALFASAMAFVYWRRRRSAGA